jgi:hypothetical protein
MVLSSLLCPSISCTARKFLRTAVDQRGSRAPQCVRTVGSRIQTDLRHPAAQCLRTGASTNEGVPGGRPGKRKSSLLNAWRRIQATKASRDPSVISNCTGR